MVAVPLQRESQQLADPVTVVHVKRVGGPGRVAR
jgi:hypothetical protein